MSIAKQTKNPQDVFKCACGDHAYSIPWDRANEDYNEGAFWCSGTLNMLGYDQNPIIIFNPFSYSSLQADLQAQGLDDYLQCMSTTTSVSCESKRPGIRELERQGVSSIAVLTRFVWFVVTAPS